MRGSLLGSAILGMVLLSSSAVGSVYALDKGDKPMHEEGMKARMEMMEKELNLSAEQKLKVKAAREEFMGRQKALNNDIRTKREALRAELEGSNPDRSKAQGMINDIKNLQGQVMELRMEQVFKMREVLTPEQFTKMKELRAKHRAEKESQKGKMKGKGKNRK